MLNKTKYLVFVLLFVFFSSLLLKNVGADPATCGFTASPQTVNSNSSANIKLTLTNPASNPIRWIFITTPSTSYTVISATATGWNTSIDQYSETNLTNGSLNSGDSLDINLNVQIGDYISGEADWNIYTSDDPNAADGYLCTGFAPSFMEDNIPHISGVSVSNVSSGSVTVSWTTALPADSKVNYGLDDNYGKNTLDSNQVTSHSVTLKNLKANTAYHYQVISTTSGGVSDTSSDGTFLTAVEQPPITTTINVPVTNPADKTPPTISLSTKLPHVVQLVPIISGTAGDDEAVVRVEYSTDSGANWLPVDSTTGLTTKQVVFSFTPTNLDDGNYTILARAIDGGGNITATSPVMVVVDRLPPLVGGNLISLGPQVLQPDQNGIVKTLAGIDQKITLSAVGGPTSIALTAKSADSKLKTKTFSLTQSADTGLWSGIMSFEEAGRYSLIVNSIDGAGNKTNRPLNDIDVSAPATVIKKGYSKGLTGVEVKAYYLEPSSNTWVLWDGSGYSQINPQKTDKNGNFNLFLPAGKYYLKASASGYSGVTTSIFELKQPTPVSSTLVVKRIRGLHLGRFNVGWPDFSTQKVNTNLTVATKTADHSSISLIGKDLPNFSLKNTAGQTIGPLNLLGKPTVITFGSTWSPLTTQQLKALNDLQANKDINVVPVSLEEGAAKAQVYSAIAGYQLNWLADPDSVLGSAFNINSLPTHYFVNREGRVIKVLTGVLNKQEILNNLSSL